MATEDDLDRIARQERELQWTSFNEDDAWQLGSTLRELAVERQLAIVIDIRRFTPHFGNQSGAPLFYAALHGTSPDNAEWARRKANTVARLHRSSYAVGLALKTRNMTLQEKYGLPTADYASHGGAFLCSRPSPKRRRRGGPGPVRFAPSLPRVPNCRADSPHRA